MASVNDLKMRQSTNLKTEHTIKVGFLKAGAHDGFEMHSPRCHSIVCIGSGPAVLEVADRQLKLESGSLLLIGSKDQRRISGWRLQSGQVAALAFCRDVVVDGTSTSESIEYLRVFETPTDSTPQLVEDAAAVVEEIVDLMRRIGKESESPATHSALVIKTYLKMILVLIRQQTSEVEYAPTPQPREHARLQPLVQYLAQHYMDAISVDQAAQLLNMSNSHFMRYFRDTTGSAFVPYLNRLRISKAQQLLGQSSLSIHEVGGSVGFCDHSYFSSVFRRVTGMGPREYRKTLC